MTDSLSGDEALEPGGEVALVEDERRLGVGEPLERQVPERALALRQLPLHGLALALLHLHPILPHRSQQTNVREARSSAQILFGRQAGTSTETLTSL